MRTPDRSAGWRVAAVLIALAGSAQAQTQVSGRVYQRHGAGFSPISNARVSARSVSGPPIVATTHSDDFGGFVLESLSAGEWIVDVSHPRYYVATETDGGRKRILCAAQEPAAVCAEIDFEMLPAGDLAIEVLDSLGHAVDGVSVRVTRIGEVADTSRAALAGRAPEGIFRITGINPGHYRAVVEPAGRRGNAFHRREMEFAVEREQPTTRIRVVLASTRTYRVSGRVVGLEPGGDWQAFVTLEPQSVLPDEAHSARLGAPLGREGRFVVNGVPRGLYQVKLVWPRNGGLDLAGGAGQILGEITVREDLRGIQFAAARPLD